MIVNLLLIVMISCLILSLIEHRKELKETESLRELLRMYDKAEKVIKDCVVYAELPLTINGNGIMLHSCLIENLGKRPATPELLNILGVVEKN